MLEDWIVVLEGLPLVLVISLPSKHAFHNIAKGSWFPLSSINSAGRTRFVSTVAYLLCSIGCTSAKPGRAGQSWTALCSAHSTHSTHSKVPICPELWIAMDCYGSLWIVYFTACCLSAVQFKTQFKTKYIIFSKSLPSLGGGDTR